MAIAENDADTIGIGPVVPWKQEWGLIGWDRLTDGTERPRWGWFTLYRSAAEAEQTVPQGLRESR